MEQRWRGAVCCQSPLWKAVTVWGGSCWHQGHPTGVTLGPPQPPALLIDVCRCACLHDNGLHWRSPLQRPSINHTRDTERTEPSVCLCIFKTVSLGLFVCLRTLCVCVYIRCLRSSMLHYWWPLGRDESVNSGSRERGRRQEEEEVGAARDRYQSAWMHLAGLLYIDIHIQGQL